MAVVGEQELGYSNQVPTDKADHLPHQNRGQMNTANQNPAKHLVYGCENLPFIEAMFSSEGFRPQSDDCTIISCCSLRNPI